MSADTFAVTTVAAYPHHLACRLCHLCIMLNEFEMMTTDPGETSAHSNTGDCPIAAVMAS